MYDQSTSNTDTTVPYTTTTTGTIEFTIPKDQKEINTMEWYQNITTTDQWYKIIIDLKEGKISIIPIKKE